jgi:shikimate kinase
MRTRPLLNDVDTTVKLAQLLHERAPLYMEIADLTVVTDGRRIQSVAEEIHRALGFELPEA